MLSEQVEAQTEKIVDLERSLSSKRDKLGTTEDMLQHVSAFFRNSRYL